jgi:hypothetical protein
MQAHPVKPLKKKGKKRGKIDRQQKQCTIMGTKPKVLKFYFLLKRLGNLRMRCNIYPLQRKNTKDFPAQKKTHSERNHKTLGEELLTMTTST